MEEPLEKYLIIPLWLGGVDEHQPSCTRDLLLAPACNRTAIFSSWSNEALRIVWRNTGGGTPPLMSQIGIGGLLEVAGGVAIILGLLTRAVAFVLSGEMAVAYWHMAYSKPRPTGGPVLFHLPVYGRTRCRRVEPRRADSSQARRVMKVDWIERPACLIFVWCAIGLIQNLYHDKE